jgi:hypothetical protein
MCEIVILAHIWDAFGFLRKIGCDIAKTGGLFLWLQNEKKNWASVWLQLFGVCDCNQELSVVANPDYVCVVVIYLVIWYMVVSLGSVWMQKTIFCVTAKLLVISVTAKRKKELNHVWLQLFCVRDCNQELCGCKPWLCLCGCNLLGYLVYDCKPG